MANHPYDRTLSLYRRLTGYPREPLNRFMPWYEKLIRRVFRMVPKNPAYDPFIKLHGGYDE